MCADIWIFVISYSTTWLSWFFFYPPVDPPDIIQSPSKQLEVDPGSQVVFSVDATTNAGVLMYQWQLNDRDLLHPSPENISGTTTATLTISNIDRRNEGMYRCIVSNDAGRTASNHAQLTVCELLYKN